MDDIILIGMLRREMGLTEKINEKTIDQVNSETRAQSKMASLAPYIAQIQRRKKMRSINKRSNKNLNESSSKSFRIKQKSVSSLHKELTTKSKDMTNNNLIIKKFEEQINKERRTRSVQRNHDPQISKTIQNKPTLQKKSNNFFNDLYARVKSKMDKERPLKRKQFETIEEQRTRSEQGGELNMYKISYTNMTGLAGKESKRDSELDSKKRTQNPPAKKNNFRRNKYEVLQSSVGQAQQGSKINMQKQQFLSDGKIVLDKKLSNLTINIEMDKLAQRQMQNFYQQVITKQIHKSIEKSTEKYFNYESYRPTKSKNQIEVYLSTLINPNLNKISKSTNEKSDYKKQKNNEYLDYDFDFRNQQEGNSLINEQIAQEQESTLQLKKDINDFEKQRKKVEIDYFNKPEPHLDWSEDQCKIDQI